MNGEFKEYLELVNQQIKELVGIYRGAVSRSGISENEFWVWYSLGAYPPPSDVRNRHEAYGIAAENFCQVEASIKKVRGDMTKLLSTLGDVNLPTLEAVGALLNSTTLAAMDVITMAAEMKKAMTDLYAAEQSEPTPLEELAEDNGFEEAEDLEDMDADNDFDEEDE